MKAIRIALALAGGLSVVGGLVLFGAGHDRRHRLGHLRLSRNRKRHRVAGMRRANATRRHLLYYVLQVIAATVAAVISAAGPASCNLPSLGLSRAGAAGGRPLLFAQRP